MALAEPSVRRFEDEEIVDADRRDQQYGLGRILAISDGVFAFAMTLLVVDLAIPAAASPLKAQLLGQASSFISYIISFAAVAATWYGHQQNFRYIRRYDDGLIALNFLSLLVVAFLPFPTAVIGRHGAESLAAVLYAGTLSVNSLCLFLTWWYASHSRRLVGHDLEIRVVRTRLNRTLLAGVIFTVSIPVAFWQPRIAEVLWSLLVMANFALIGSQRRSPQQVASAPALRSVG